MTEKRNASSPSYSMLNQPFCLFLLINPTLVISIKFRRKYEKYIKKIAP